MALLKCLTLPWGCVDIFYPQKNKCNFNNRCCILSSVLLNVAPLKFDHFWFLLSKMYFIVKTTRLNPSPVLLLSTVKCKLWTITLYTLLHPVLRSPLSTHCEMCWYRCLSFFFFSFYLPWFLMLIVILIWACIFLPTDLMLNVEWCILRTCSLYSVAKPWLHQFSKGVLFFYEQKYTCTLRIIENML